MAHPQNILAEEAEVLAGRPNWEQKSPDSSVLSPQAKTSFFYARQTWAAPESDPGCLRTENVRRDKSEAQESVGNVADLHMFRGRMESEQRI